MINELERKRFIDAGLTDEDIHRLMRQGFIATCIHCAHVITSWCCKNCFDRVKTTVFICDNCRPIHDDVCVLNPGEERWWILSIRLIPPNANSIKSE